MAGRACSALTQWITPPTFRSVGFSPSPVAGSNVPRSAVARRPTTFPSSSFSTLGAGDDVAVAEADGGAGREPLPALRRDLGEVVALDPQLAREREPARARGVGGRRHVVRPVRRVDPLRVLGQVLDRELQRVGHGEDARGDGVEVVADGVLVARELDAAVDFGDADLVEKRSDGLGSDAAPSLRRERRHPRVVPARARGPPRRAGGASACSSPCSRC